MIELEVTGMTCGHCEMAVRKALSRVPGGRPGGGGQGRGLPGQAALTAHRRARATSGPDRPRR